VVMVIRPVKLEDEVDFELCQLISTLVDRSAGTRDRACRLRASSGCAQSERWQIGQSSATYSSIDTCTWPYCRKLSVVLLHKFIFMAPSVAYGVRYSLYRRFPESSAAQAEPSGTFRT
jgi:hypothetical protein